MAEFMLHQGSEEFIKPTTFNLSKKDLLTETERIITENATSAHSKNEEHDSKPLDGGAGDSKLQKSNQKRVVCTSMLSRLSVSRSYKPNFNDVTQIKISALLYEITDRVNRLAEPRSRVTEIKASQKLLKNRIPKLTPRICELACPKVIHDSPSKPVGFVSPNALKAIATQRIIELSQPRKDRKDRSFKLRRHKPEIHRSCNLRIRGLSQMKQVGHLRSAAKFFESSMKNKSELLQESSCSTLNVRRHVKNRQKRLEQKNKLEVSKKKQKQELLFHYPNDRSSNRSVVIIDLDRKSDLE